MKMASNPSFNSDTGGLEVATAYASQASGKTVLVTGVSSGTLGEAIVKSFAKGGASTIIITGRSDNSLEETVKSLSTEYPSTKFRPLKLQLDSLKLVNAAAQELLDDPSIPHIDITIACAGVHNFSTTRLLTTDGLEWHFGINHIANFVFINKLLPKIRAAATKSSTRGSTRIVVVGSETGNLSPFRFSDYQFDGKPVPAHERPSWDILKVFGVQETEAYNHFVAYAQSKTANVLFAVHFNKMLAAENQDIRVFTIHPGLVNSKFAAQAFAEEFTAEQKAVFARIGLGRFKDVDQGAATAVVAALDPGLGTEEGIYLTDCQVGGALEWQLDGGLARKLWDLTERIVGEKAG
ncbi:retinol dehydrogenase 12, partial [Dendryphion nanum]